MFSKGGRLEKIRAMILAGNGNRLISRETGASKCTVAKARNQMKAEMAVIGRCRCGQDANHQGWCAYRYDKSEKRKAFIAQWPDKKVIDQATKIMEDARVSA